MTKSHRDYPTFVYATVDGEVIERPTTIDGEVIERPTTAQPIVSMQPASIARHDEQRLKRQVEKGGIERAKGFAIRTRALSIATGAATTSIWLLVKWALPLTQGASTAGVLVVGAVAIVSGLLAFLAVWSAAYVLDIATGPGGVDLFESWRTQRRIDRQSDAMVEAFRKQNGVEK